MPGAHVFDKAAFHLDSVRALGLADHQANVHIGLFFGWLVDRGMNASWLEDRMPEAFAAFRSRSLTGPALVARWDGALLDDMLSDEGLAFAAAYYGAAGAGWRHGYLDDLRDTLTEGLPSPHHVEDSWQSFDTMCSVLDARHAEWRAEADPDAPRIDLRTDESAVEPPPARSEMQVVPVQGGVALPRGPLGLSALIPRTVSALRSAYEERGWIALFPSLHGGPAAHVDELSPIGVWATVEQLRTTDQGVDVVLACGTRVGRIRWVDEAAYRAEVRLWPEPPLTAADVERIEQVRHMVAELVRTRRSAGEPVGMLALAASASGAGLLDIAARSAGLSFDEQLLALEESDVGERAEIVRAALMRMQR